MNLTHQRWLEDYTDTAVFRTVPARSRRGRHRGSDRLDAVWPATLVLVAVLSALVVLALVTVAS